jgi:hypothetical protein
MRHGFGLLLILSAAACRRPDAAPPLQGAAPVTMAGASDELVTEPDSFIHQRGWSQSDSLIGAWMKVGYKRQGRLLESGAGLPTKVRFGRSTGEDLRAQLGTASGTAVHADTTLMTYASPFIGPDEAVVFHLVADTIRQVSWELYSD